MHPNTNVSLKGGEGVLSFRRLTLRKVVKTQSTIHNPLLTFLASTLTTCIVPYHLHWNLPLALSVTTCIETYHLHCQLPVALSLTTCVKTFHLHWNLPLALKPTGFTYHLHCHLQHALKPTTCIVTYHLHWHFPFALTLTTSIVEKVGQILLPKRAFKKVSKNWSK